MPVAGRWSPRVTSSTFCVHRLDRSWPLTWLARTLACVAPLLLVTCAPAPAGQTDLILDAASRRVVIHGVLARLRATYLYRETAAAMDQAIRARARRGEYDRITSARAFADSLTTHLRAVSRDRHVRVQFSPTARSSWPWRRSGTHDSFDSSYARGRRARFGFGRVDRLAGNVGYVEIRSFGFEPELAEAAVAQVMKRLARTDALIVDLRRNGGGSPRLVTLASSYFLGPDSIHLATLQWPRRGRVERVYTRGAVLGGRYGSEKPVYVLTSQSTFSAAESFAYGLQALGRAVIVGDTTGGGAYVGGMHRVTDHFGVWVSAGRPVNPVTRRNWERVGVRPDVPVLAEQALTAAHSLALRTLLEREPDAERRKALERELIKLPESSAATPDR